VIRLDAADDESVTVSHFPCSIGFGSFFLRKKHGFQLGSVFWTFNYFIILNFLGMADGPTWRPKPTWWHWLPCLALELETCTHTLLSLLILRGLLWVVYWFFCAVCQSRHFFRTLSIHMSCQMARRLTQITSAQETNAILLLTLLPKTISYDIIVLRQLFEMNYRFDCRIFGFLWLFSTGHGISSRATEFDLFHGILQKLRNDWWLDDHQLDNVIK